MELNLDTAWLGRALRHVERCDSTNDEAAAWARAGAPHGAVVIADAQERGRGRLGRAWHSPPGESLYFSAVLRPDIEPRRLPPLVLALGVGVHEAVAELGLDPELKWPNDVRLGERKLAGMLTEMSTSGGRVAFVVAGIGVNLNNSSFPPPLDDIAVSLSMVLGRPVDRGDFVAQLCRHVESWCDRFFVEGAPPILDEWRARTRMFGREISVSQGGAPFRAVAEDIDEEGALLVRGEDGARVRVVAGDIEPAR